MECGEGGDPAIHELFHSVGADDADGAAELVGGRWLLGARAGGACQAKKRYEHAAKTSSWEDVAQWGWEVPVVNRDYCSRFSWAAASPGVSGRYRSEEHTSELQSLRHL